ncbi:MAG: acetylxylan esterase [Thermoguttaceae bacterium]
MRTLLQLGSLAVLSLVALCGASAAELRVLPPGQLPKDARLAPLKDENGYFPFTPPKTREAWQQRAEQVRRQILVAAGLWPMPAKTSSHAVIRGRVDREGYTVEKVYFQIYPGHFVTGSLYRPKGRTGRLPAVLAPHGHWANGRFFDAGAKEIRWQLVRGEERFEVAGRYILQALCVQLARMGCVVFQYDMVGVADSRQLPHSPEWQPKRDTPDRWGLASPQAEAWLETNFGLQTYNSIRALDFVCGLPDVDPSRIGITGGSGGATQTFILCAIDPRPAVAFPAVMVSTEMQGGCNCENAPYLRIDTGNVEFAALFAPKPLGMTAADDWTHNMATKGFPELKQRYKLLGAEENVMLKAMLQFGHNYNYVSRAVIYSWFNKHLKLGLTDPIVEEDFRPLSIAELSVWDDQHPAPPGDYAHQQAFLHDLTEATRRQIGSLAPKDEPSLAEYRRIVGGAVQVMIGRGLPEPGSLEVADCTSADLGPHKVMKFLLRYPAKREELPVVRLIPKQWNRRAVIWVDPEGKRALLAADGRPRPGVQRLLDAGYDVLGVDLFGQGEFTHDGKPLDKSRLVDGHIEFTFGYNPSTFSQRVRDLLTLVAFERGGRAPADRVYMIGLAGAGHWVAAARAIAGSAIDRAAIDTAGFRFARIAAFDNPDFLPGGAKYNDLPGMIALSAPNPLWLAGEGDTLPPIISATYRAAGQPENITLHSGDAARESAAVEWLLK